MNAIEKSFYMVGYLAGLHSTSVPIEAPPMSEPGFLRFYIWGFKMGQLGQNSICEVY